MGLKLLFCIRHGEMVVAEDGEITGRPLHIVAENFGHGIEMDWCEGPFASCEPPEMTDEYWDMIFEDEKYLTKAEINY